MIIGPSPVEVWLTSLVLVRLLPALALLLLLPHMVIMSVNLPAPTVLPLAVVAVKSKKDPGVFFLSKETGMVLLDLFPPALPKFGLLIIISVTPILILVNKRP